MNNEEKDKITQWNETTKTIESIEDTISNGRDENDEGEVGKPSHDEEKKRLLEDMKTTHPTKILKISNWI